MESQASGRFVDNSRPVDNTRYSKGIRPEEQTGPFVLVTRQINRLSPKQAWIDSFPSEEVALAQAEIDAEVEFSVVNATAVAKDRLRRLIGPRNRIVRPAYSIDYRNAKEPSYRVGLDHLSEAFSLVAGAVEAPPEGLPVLCGYKLSQKTADVELPSGQQYL